MSAPPIPGSGESAAIPPPLPVQPPRYLDPDARREILKVDSRRASVGELWRDSQPAINAMLVVLFAKFFRIKIPGVGNDLHVQSLTPFEMDWATIPRETKAEMQSFITELESCGFEVQSGVAYYVRDSANSFETTIFAMPHRDKRAVARIHH